jgi:hypothetical protein
VSDTRSAEEVLDDHLATSLNGDIEEDLSRNYAPDVVVVSNWGVERGHDGMRRMGQLLRRQLPDCTFTYRLRIVEGEIAMLAWSASSTAASVHDGVDSYVIRDGLIQAQTICYSIEPAD